MNKIMETIPFPVFSDRDAKALESFAKDDVLTDLGIEFAPDVDFVNNSETAAVAENIAYFKDVAALEAYMRTRPDQVNWPVKHDFLPGMYSRTLAFPKGAIIVSKIHKTGAFFIMRSGICQLATNGQKGILKAGDMLITKPWDQRFLIALEDCTVTVIHHNPDNLMNEEDLLVMYTGNHDELREQLMKDVTQRRSE